MAVAFQVWFFRVFTADDTKLLQVTESDAVDVVESILKDTRAKSATVAFALTALLKLSSRFPECSM